MKQISLDDLAKSRELEPRDVTFAAPWEARAFALVLHLVDRGCFTWEEFRQQLIAEIGVADSHRAGGQAAASYHECWLKALEALVKTKALLGGDEIEQQSARILAHPPTPTKAVRGPITIA